MKSGMRIELGKYKRTIERDWCTSNDLVWDLKGRYKIEKLVY